jgi:multiple sugar transport system permease protein
MLRKRIAKPWIMVLPSLCVMLAVVIFPLLYSLRLSFIQWDALVPGQKFVGFKNFVQVLLDKRFLASLIHTGVLLAGIITIEFLLGFLLALCLLEEFKLKKLVTATFILPVTIIPTVTGFIWKLMLDARYGPINHMLSIMFRRDVQYTWLAHTNTAYLSLIITDVWQWTPFMILVLLAGLVALPKDTLEAADIDGASEWQKIRFVTLPMLKPVIVVALLIRSLDLLKLFDIVFAMTQGGPGTSTETLSYYIYRNGFEYFRMGYTAAMSYVVLVIVSIIITFLLQRLGEVT